MSKLSRELKKIFWKLPLPNDLKENMRQKYAEKKFVKETKAGNQFECIPDKEAVNEYAHYVLESPDRKNEEFADFIYHDRCKDDVTLIAYYLTQYSPDAHNDVWWGKGTTEWNNVSKAVPQYAGHIQPKLPGELGFYDLRIRENMARQIELAKNYGVDCFSFYYYWFAGERILESPLNMFLNDKTLDIPFMFCWANENWTKRFSGTDEGILIGMDNTEENYKDFIHEVIPFFKDPRYFKINGKVALQIYRPNFIPNVKSVISYWRNEVRSACGCDLYLIACQSRDVSYNWCGDGFDAENEWMQGSIKLQCKDITQKMKAIRKDFKGEIIDYKDMVINKKYYVAQNRAKKVFPAVMPSWDNTARRNNKGTIWHGSTPALYKQWLGNIIEEVKESKTIDAPIIFINAWNEWGEGTYLEPDRDFGYAYLQATWEAKNES